MVPLIGIGGATLYKAVFSANDLTGVVLNEYTDEPVSGATVVAGATQLSSNQDGEFQLENSVTEVAVQKQGFDPTAVTVTPGSSSIEVRIRPNVVQGIVTNTATQKPIPGVAVEISTAAGPAGSTTTDEKGAFLLSDVPEGATITIDSPDFSKFSAEVGRQTRIDAALRPDVLVGTVLDDSGAPLAGASIAIGSARTQSGEDGSFRLEGAPETGEVVVKKPGYLSAAAPIDASMRVQATLKPFLARALYATAGTASDPNLFNNLLAIADRTEINAMVVDLKDSSGFVFYDTQVQLAKDIGAVSPVLDPRQITQRLRERNLYSIARIVVFEDPILAEKRPELAIKDSSNGDLWRTWNGLAWVNAHRSEVWDYNIALAVEAANMGFDEIQLDYIRFPSDGPLNRAEYGVPQNSETRPAAIGQFLSRMADALAPTHSYLAADVFGLTLWELEDGGIGQNLEVVSKYLDYVCPMVYPSHFYPGSMGFDIPNNHPYEVILWSLEAGEKRVPEHKAKMRPWIQDFSYGEGIDYGANEVRRQIDAANDFGPVGWMVWNAANVYHDGALAAQ